MIFVFILFIRCVCFVRMLSCSIHLYRTGRLIFPENALPCHVPGGFCYRHKTSPVCFGKLASREKVKGNDRVTFSLCENYSVWAMELIPTYHPCTFLWSTESLLYYRVLYLIIPEVHRNNGACQTVIGHARQRELDNLQSISASALLLGVQEHDIAPLIASKMLTPLGKPASNSPNHFAAVEIVARADDRDWLSEATKALAKHWRHKNRGNYPLSLLL